MSMVWSMPYGLLMHFARAGLVSPGHEVSSFATIGCTVLLWSCWRAVSLSIQGLFSHWCSVLALMYEDTYEDRCPGSSGLALGLRT